MALVIQEVRQLGFSDGDIEHDTISVTSVPGNGTGPQERNCGTVPGRGLHADDLSQDPEPIGSGPCAPMAKGSRLLVWWI